LHTIAHIQTDSLEGVNVDLKPQVIGKAFWKTTPTVVCWDGDTEARTSVAQGTEREGKDLPGDEDEVWDTLGVVTGDGEKDTLGSRVKRRKIG